MNRIDKENLLLQTLMAIAGAALLAIGIVTVVSAWRGPGRPVQPAVSNVSTTAQPNTPSANEPAAEPAPGEQQRQDDEPAAPPAGSVAAGPEDLGAEAENPEVTPDGAEPKGPSVAETLAI